MTPPIQLLSTDFDGTFHTDFESPPVPVELQELIGQWQRQGMLWVINTGRDLTSLMEGMARARLSIQPDYVVVVEREIYRHRNHRYESDEDWNRPCTARHAELFARTEKLLRQLRDAIEKHHRAETYADAWSPLCVIAGNNAEADAIQERVLEFLKAEPELIWVRNDIYARLSNADYNKGTAMTELGRRIGTGAEGILAAGDHWNDLPMLMKSRAAWLVAPSNAIDAVRERIATEGGYQSQAPAGRGVLDGLKTLFKKH